MATYDLGKVVGDAGEKGDDGSTVWNTSTAPTYANSKYTFTISNLSGKTGLQIAVNDIIFYSTYYYIVSAVNTATVDCTTRISIKGSDASVTIVDNLTSTSSTSALSAKQGKVLNDNKIETSSIATSFGSTPSDSKVASEKLVKNSLDAKQATLVSGTNIKTVNNNSLLGSGNITIESGSNVDIVTNWEQTLSDAKVPSEKLTKDSLDTKVDKVTGKGLSTNDFSNSYKSAIDGLSTVATTGDYDDLSNKPSIPSSSSDLSDGSSLVKTSSTSGLLKNDGSVDTTQYLSSLPSHNHDDRYYTESEMDTALNGKLDTAVTSTAVTMATNDNILITDYSDSNKVKRVSSILASQVKDSSAYSNLETSANATQATINAAINTKLGNVVDILMGTGGS